MVVKMLFTVLGVVPHCGLVGGYQLSSISNVSNGNICKSGHL
jgi:hypothetical protein